MKYETTPKNDENKNKFPSDKSNKQEINGEELAADTTQMMHSDLKGGEPQHGQHSTRQPPLAVINHKRDCITLRQKIKTHIPTKKKGGEN
ncbi:hypothetical protein E2C01_038086 [Portunus trituberculatus]|uniref:Uncharacterized protein n=1 Tax=Portunus trituberculatus TaxID=210409 RepID=A0A5B7FH27_PORTR|nr:hypothetical protein [Portunus trituberculatus]